MADARALTPDNFESVSAKGDAKSTCSTESDSWTLRYLFGTGPDYSEPGPSWHAAWTRIREPIERGTQTEEDTVQDVLVELRDAGSHRQLLDADVAEVEIQLGVLRGLAGTLEQRVGALEPRVKAEVQSPPASTRS